jgi:hypothetical protein
MMHTPVGTLEKDAVPPPYSTTIPDQPTVIDVDVMSRVISLRNKDECNNLTSSLLPKMATTIGAGGVQRSQNRDTDICIDLQVDGLALGIK